MRVHAWSRPLADAQRLAGAGIAVHRTAASAAAEADLVVTMAPDAEAIKSFATGPDGFLEAMRPGAVWVQCSTIGVRAADGLAALAERHGVTHVDAPVLGSREPAERGELVMLASGPDEAIDRCVPLFAAIASSVVRLGATGNGSRMKMVTNTWIVSAVASVAESIALAEALELDPQLFLRAVEGTAMDMGYLQIKGAMIAGRSYPVQMSLANGAKDARLALEAARERELPARMIAAAEEMMRAAVDAGHAGEDMAAAFHAATANAHADAGGKR